MKFAITKDTTKTNIGIALQNKAVIDALNA
jgi:hypothetical protein